VAVKLAEEPDSPLENIQIFLRDGKMTMKGDAKVGSLTAPATLVIDVTVDEDGKIAATIRLPTGPVPVPRSCSTA
jgi:hypothetical protein